MPAPLLQIENLSKSYGDYLLWGNVDLSIFKGDKIGLIAPNGAGKTSFFNIISKKDVADSGNIIFQNDIKTAFLEQAPQYDPNLTILDTYLQSSHPIVKLVGAYEQALIDGDEKKLSELLTQMDLHNAWGHEEQMRQVFGKLGLNDLSKPIKTLSGGQVKRVALANTLLLDADLLILDEPTNHLDLEMVEWLEEMLKNSNCSLLMITHDRYFLDNICNSILEIDQKNFYLYRECRYNNYLEKREQRIAAERSEMARSKNLLKKEQEWMSRQPQARATKAKSRIDAFYDLKDKVQGGGRSDQQIELKGGASYIGKKIFEAKHISKKFGDIVIADDFNYTFSRFEKLGIIGQNGTGKTSFLRMLLGETTPDEGVFDIGETIRFGYYSQSGLEFDDKQKIIDFVRNISDKIDFGDGNSMTASQLLQHFLFSPARQNDFIEKLSGGERRRLHLCCVLMQNPNFLVLDEPTNDLDIFTLSLLEDYLRRFKGCVIVVSHDRYFMDEIVDHLFVFEGSGVIKDFPGNYSQYRQSKKRVSAIKEDDNTSKESRKQKQNENKNEAEKTKLTFKEKIEFETLEKEIESLEKEKEKLLSALSSSDLSSEELMTKSTRYSQLEHELNEKSERWLILSEYKK